MAKRLMAVITSSGDDGPYRAQAKVYRDSEWDEWRVRYYHGDELLSYLGEESDSFHGDQADAMGTAEAQVKQLAKGAMGRKENPVGFPEQIRVDRKKTPQGTFKVTATFGLADTKTFFVSDWKAFLEQRGWSEVPRVFG